MRVFLGGKQESYHNYQRAVERAGGIIQFEGSPQMCDALLLPGGGDLEPWRYGQDNRGSRDPDPERDGKEFEWLDQFVRSGKPVLGICRGLQVINVFFGGTLIQDLTGHSAVGGKDRLHTVYTTDRDMQRVCGGESVVVNSAHHQAIDRTGEGLQVLQRAADGTVEAVRHESLPVLAVQWHPERLGTSVGDGVFEWFIKTGFF